MSSGIEGLKRWETKSVLLWGSAAVVLVVRLIYCFATPLYTTDVLRNLGYGSEFWYYGFRVYDLTPNDFSPELYQFFFPNHHYTYPAIALLFYALIAKIWSSLFFAKLVFTLLDVVNSGLIYRLTRDRGCAWLYFCHPIGIWFVSHEGQFEPLVNLVSLIALLQLQKQKPSCGFWLMLAIQTKLFPVFLAPYFVVRGWPMLSKQGGRCLAWMAAGLVPSLAAAWHSAYLSHLFLPGYVPKVNPITWALFDRGLHGFEPFELVLIHGLAGILFVTICLYFIYKDQAFLPYLASLVFVVFVKANPIGQYWYLLTAPVMCLTVENATRRRILLGMTWLFGFRSIWSILIGPIGYVNLPTVMEVLEMAKFGV